GGSHGGWRGRTTADRRAHGRALQGRPRARGGGRPRRARWCARARCREHGRGPGLSVAMPDLDLIKTLSPLGVGGLLAVMIFVFYRLDFLRERQNHQVERERQAKREERLLDMIERNAGASERLAVTIENLGTMLQHDGRRA